MRFRIGALAVLALAAGVIAWLALRDNSSSPAQTKASHAKPVTPQEVVSLASEVNHPVYWLGAKSGYTYELTKNSDGAILIRYLPPGVNVGDSKPYLTVATYPFPGAFGALQTVAKRDKSKELTIAQGGIAVPSKSYPESVHVAYPNVDYQVEVFDPTPGTATTLVRSGQLLTIGPAATASATTPPVIGASISELRSLAGALGHPVYWVGPRKGYTYELKQSAGDVYIRYLPPGVQVGASGIYLTIATYPFPGALAAIQSLAGEKGRTAVKLRGGGLAVIDPTAPRNIHLAFPGAPAQVEVFDKSPASIRQLVKSGRISAIG